MANENDEWKPDPNQAATAADDSSPRFDGSKRVVRSARANESYGEKGSSVFVPELGGPYVRRIWIPDEVRDAARRICRALFADPNLKPTGLDT